MRRPAIALLTGAFMMAHPLGAAAIQAQSLAEENPPQRSAEGAPYASDRWAQTPSGDVVAGWFDQRSAESEAILAQRRISSELYTILWFAAVIGGTFLFLELISSFQD